MNNTVIIDGKIYLTDIPLLEQEGVPVDAATWYDSHGMPNPDNAAQILLHRQASEVKRKRETEENFWKEIGKRVKFSFAIIQDDSIDFSEGGQCISSPNDIKLNFR